MAVSMTYNSLLADLRSYLERGGSAIVDPVVFNQLPKLIDLAERTIARRLKIQGFIEAMFSSMQAGGSVLQKPNRWRRTVGINFGQGNVWSIGIKSSVGLTRTLFTDRPHGLIVGNSIIASGVGSGYDGQYTLTAVGYLSVTYTGATALNESNVVASNAFMSQSGTLRRRTQLFTRSYEFCRAYWPDETQTGIPRYYADYDYSHWLIVPTPRQPYPFEVMSWCLPQQLDNNNQTNWLTEFAPNVLLYGTLCEAEPYLKEDDRIAVWKNFWAEGMDSLEKEDISKMMDRASNRDAA